MRCRLFTGLKAASQEKVGWLVKGSASMRECLDASLSCAPVEVQLLDRHSRTKVNCIKVYNEDVIRRLDGTCGLCSILHIIFESAICLWPVMSS
jgi:hypothetical protein